MERKYLITDYAWLQDALAEPVELPSMEETPEHTRESRTQPGDCRRKEARTRCRKLN